MEIKDYVSVEEGILQLVRIADETEWENNHWVILGEPSPTEIKQKPHPTMRFRKSLSAVCYLFGRDAVRPERAETTLQLYTIRFNSKDFLFFHETSLTLHPISKEIEINK